MLKFEQKKRNFHLRIDDSPPAKQEDAKDDEPDSPRKFKVPENAQYELKNTLGAYITTLIEGEMPKDGKVTDPEPDAPTRQAIMFACEPDLDPHKVKMTDWVLHDGSSLTQGTISTILLHRPVAERMSGYDVVYRVVPNPRAAGEIAIAAIYLCPSGTQETLVSAHASTCLVCERLASIRCMCMKVWFCTESCRLESIRLDLHNQEDCLKEYASSLVKRADEERKKAIERGKEFKKQRERVEKKVEEAKASRGLDKQEG